MEIKKNDLVEILRRNFFGSTDREIKVVTEVFEKEDFWGADVSFEEVEHSKLENNDLDCGSRCNVSEVVSIVGSLSGLDLNFNHEYIKFTNATHENLINSHLNSSF